MLSIGALQPGSFVDRYRIIRRLAVGGMAELYLACATGIEGFEKHVALKRILPQFACRPEFVGMFLDEARLAATLHHPNIAQVYDIGTDGDTYYFTMEFVDGRDVRHLRKRAAALEEDVPLDHTISIMMGVAAGLHSAHEKRGSDGKPLGIVHRDVSPANVIVTYDGNVKLIDFGIAKAARRQTQTRTGILKGKSCNMSPEQCLAEPVDRRSDVFSLGILLYELSTGTRLFDGESEFETMRHIVDGRVVPPSRRCPAYPVALEQIVMRALERDPDDRYQSAQQMFIDLDCFAREERLAVGAYHLSEYVKRMFPDHTDPSEQGASPPLFLLGDDAELPEGLAALVGAEPVVGDETADLDAELAVDVELDDREVSDEVSMERAATLEVSVHEATPGDMEATIDRARSPELPTPSSRPRSSPGRRADLGRDDEPESARAATIGMGSRPRERRLQSEVATSLVKLQAVESAQAAKTEPDLEARHGVFRSGLSLLSLIASLLLAVAVLAYGLFAEDGWFAANPINTAPAAPAADTARARPSASPVIEAVPAAVAPEPIVTRKSSATPAKKHAPVDQAPAIVVPATAPSPESEPAPRQPAPRKQATRKSAPKSDVETSADAAPAKTAPAAKTAAAKTAAAAKAAPAEADAGPGAAEPAPKTAVPAPARGLRPAPPKAGTHSKLLTD